jgi:hypothetical protein
MHHHVRPEPEYSEAHDQRYENNDTGAGSSVLAPIVTKVVPLSHRSHLVPHTIP